jgi:hypothetical protein
VIYAPFASLGIGYTPIEPQVNPQNNFLRFAAFGLVRFSQDNLRDVPARSQRSKMSGALTGAFTSICCIEVQSEMIAPCRKNYRFKKVRKDWGSVVFRTGFQNTQPFRISIPTPVISNFE